MPFDRNKGSFLQFVYFCLHFGLLLLSPTLAATNGGSSQPAAHDNEVNPLENTIRDFNPQIEYNNEWRPVGRGDPLKNDPTYDYSPPVLDRVRYWAANENSKDGKKSKSEATSGSYKNEILLMGTSSLPTKPSVSATSKSVRKHENYRAAATLPLYSNKKIKNEVPILQPKFPSIRRSYYAQHMPPTHLMPPPMHAQTSGPNSLAMGQHLKPTSDGWGATSSISSGMPASNIRSHYMTTMSNPWMHSSSSSTMQHHNQQRVNMMPSPRDSFQQESATHLNYMQHPNNNPADNYRPNSIRNSNSGRKPWLHELLLKELVKPTQATIKNKMPAYTLTKPITAPRFEPIVVPSQGFSTSVSTTYSPYAHISSSSTISSTNTPIYITSAMPHFVTNEYTTPKVPLTSTTEVPTSKRLLIPETSNLPYRPTVASLEMTTDSLFKHYKQPEKPMAGPMYLIIEGHSKVKSYGKNEIDPHQPKIVPIIPKREPVVRIVDPNERRGTIETFQVKHLHTKLTTTPLPPVTPTTPKLAASKNVTTTTQSPKIFVTTEGTATASPSSTLATEKLSHKPLEKFEMPASNSKQAIANLSSTTPSTLNIGMKSLLNFLDDSLDSILKNRAEAQSNNSAASSSKSTYLRPVATTTSQPSLDARISSAFEQIEAEEDDVKQTHTTTEPIPREVRQVFDYDQLPESRLKQLKESADSTLHLWNEDINDNIEWDEDEEDYVANNDDAHQLIKRIDNLTMDSDEDEFEEFDMEDDEAEIFDERSTT